MDMDVAMNENGLELMNLIAARAWLEELTAEIKAVPAKTFKFDYPAVNLESFGAATVGYSAATGINAKATTKNDALGQIACSLYSIESEISALKRQMKPLEAETVNVEITGDDLMDLFFA